VEQTVRKFSLIVILLFAGPVSAEYRSEEFAFIPWGDGPGQLKIEMPVWVDVNGTPDDPSDDLIEDEAGGPSLTFIDAFENIYVSSYGLNYLKAFDSSGQLIIDFSYGTPAYDSIVNGATIGTFYVDSLSRIYLLTFPPTRYIAVIDTLGGLLDKLNPLGPNSNISVCAMDYNSLDILSVCSCNRELYTYENGNFTPGGAMGWKAIDGYYYYASPEDSTLIRFIRYSNPGIDGIPPDLEETFVPYQPFFQSCGSLGVDDSMRIFVYVVDTYTDTRVQIYSTAYQLLDEVFFAPLQNKYWKFLSPFMRADGTLYEFRCLDDGVHVVRWSEQ
jgi:hypothetical protein